MRVDTISAIELDEYAKREDAIIVDVRNSEEFKKRHICGAVNIQLDGIEKINFKKEKLLILYCERGAASLLAASKLQNKGYRVKSVVGGINAYRGRLVCRD